MLTHGIGYNGFPRGCSDDKLSWAKKSMTGDPLETKYPYVCHAEVNAILNTNHASAAGQNIQSRPTCLGSSLSHQQSKADQASLGQWVSHGVAMGQSRPDLGWLGSSPISN
ncbi:hypothetical protein Taro_031076 [Colocasia esculenta]|uniref:Uncharacterized protein n=1 Tax=Colocasia esculenta TaxID=4460 RepID=A0A843W239_COLES|nr:hypothetical protein [Colocasia esculenta]